MDSSALPIPHIIQGVALDHQERIRNLLRSAQDFFPGIVSAEKRSSIEAFISSAYEAASLDYNIEKESTLYLLLDEDKAFT